MNRRRFLTLLGGSSAGLAAGGYLLGRGDGSPATGPSSALGLGAAARAGGSAAGVSDRLLVVIEMPGGNDGLSMLVPYADAGYRKLRSATMIDPKAVLHLDDAVGLHPKLTRLHDRGAVIVQGVGTPNPDLSHFAMLDRWWAGDLRGDGAPGTGFFGRLCDAIGSGDDPCVGLSIGTGPTRALVAEKVTTLALPDLDAAQVLAPNDDDDQLRAFQAGFEAMMAGSDDDPFAPARRGGRDALSFAALARSAGDPAGDNAYPGFDLANRLALAARLLATDVGIRVVHTAFGDFDTHDDHVNRYDSLMDELDQSLDAFLADLDGRGLADRVLVMTISEFGRRAQDNGSAGLDHGTASVALMVGPVQAERLGAMPSLTKLDDEDNLKATVGMDEYYATVAERWFEVPAGDVLSGAGGRAPKPLPLHVL
jgi:uncharacterized protein (DUF1501 family)